MVGLSNGTTFRHVTQLVSAKRFFCRIVTPVHSYSTENLGIVAPVHCYSTENLGIVAPVHCYSTENLGIVAPVHSYSTESLSISESARRKSYQFHKL